jgi:hypothetical protein
MNVLPDINFRSSCKFHKIYIIKVLLNDVTLLKCYNDALIILYILHRQHIILFKNPSIYHIYHIHHLYFFFLQKTKLTHLN